MHLFLKLILAHMIGDFILQFEELYQLKVRSVLGHFFHAAIHGTVSLLLAFPYLSRPGVVPFLITLAVIHHFQDVIKYSIQGKHPEMTFYCFTIDQIIHILFIATVFLLPAAKTPAGFPNHPDLDYFYSGNLWTLGAIAFITSTFKGAYFLHSVKKTFVPGSRPLHFITSREVTHGIFERGFITSCFLLLPWPAALLLSPAAGIGRLVSRDLKNAQDFALSFSYAVLTGLFFSFWIGRL